MDDGRLLTRAGELRTDRTPFVLATVVRAERPASARPGDRALVLADGTVEGFVGGSCAESTTRAESLRLLSSGEAGLLRITPGGDAEPSPPGVRTVDNPCLSGGALEIFLEPVLPPALVVVVGDAPVARALVRLGAALDHEVVVPADPAAPPAADTAAVVVASHGRDETEVLAAALRAGVPYVALVASRRRAEGVLAAVAALGVPDTGRVRAPAGLDIGARTPSDIALSIYAQFAASRSGRADPGPDDGPRPPRAAEQTRMRTETETETVTDPVCGMAVVPVAATPSAEHGGVPVRFCGPGCRDAFLADPARYAR